MKQPDKQRGDGERLGGFRLLVPDPAAAPAAPRTCLSSWPIAPLPP
jgi:hypothetical protein